MSERVSALADPVGLRVAVEIAASPGIHVSALRRRLGLAQNRCYNVVAKLEAARVVRSEHVKGKRHLYLDERFDKSLLRASHTAEKKDPAVPAPKISRPRRSKATPPSLPVDAGDLVVAGVPHSLDLHVVVIRESTTANPLWWKGEALCRKQHRSYGGAWRLEARASRSSVCHLCIAEAERQGLTQEVRTPGWEIREEPYAQE